MRICFITSNHIRHKFLAHALADNLDLAGIVAEEKSKKIKDTTPYNPEEKEIIDSHFALRDVREKEFFGPAC